MNLVDCKVTKILGPPIAYKYPDITYYTVHVEYESWGRFSKTELPFTTIEAANKLKVGFVFLG